MWREAHRGCRSGSDRDDYYHPWLWRCGYVLWDASDTPLDMEDLRKRLNKARPQTGAQKGRIREARKEMEKSWAERAFIYKQGGRGYWSEDDLSKVVWNEGAGTTSQ